MRYLDRVSFTTSQRIKGLQTGTHKARLRGGTTEFTEHRPYSVGDEVRRLDWRIVGRSDRLEIKLYDDPSILETVILMDGSGSMGFTDSVRSKFDFGCSIVAFLSKVILKERDPLGLLLAKDGAPGMLRPVASIAQLDEILQILLSTRSGGPTRIAEQLRFLTKNLRHPTRVIIVSDAFFDLESFESEIALLTGRRHRFHLLQTLAPEEISFNYRQPLRFKSLEANEHLDVNPMDLMESYLASMERHIAALRRICQRYRAGYEPLVTDQSVGRSMVDFIARNSDYKS
jgi:uncharacterized protein (DUF58 family)